MIIKFINFYNFPIDFGQLRISITFLKSYAFNFFCKNILRKISLLYIHSYIFRLDHRILGHCQFDAIDISFALGVPWYHHGADRRLKIHCRRYIWVWLIWFIPNHVVLFEKLTLVINDDGVAAWLNKCTVHVNRRLWDLGRIPNPDAIILTRVFNLLRNYTSPIYHFGIEKL